MKKLTRVINDIDVSRVISVPPRNSQLPRSASIAAMEKHTNTSVVPSNAVIIIDGSTTLTYSIRGPMLIPVTQCFKHNLCFIFFLTNSHWACVVGYCPCSLCVIHKEGLCPSSGDIKLMMICIIFIVQS
jgi:hypothetical protein